MDEREFVSVFSNLIPVPCVFQKSILASYTQCLQSTKKNIGEREVVMCSSQDYAERCAQWLTVLRQKSQFSLQMPDQQTVLPHSKEMKVQVGGILGLYKVLQLKFGEDKQPDIFRALDACNGRTANFNDVSFTEIVREIVHFRSR